MSRDPIAEVMRQTLISPNVSDSNLEEANVVDALDNGARGLHAIALALDRLGLAGAFVGGRLLTDSEDDAVRELVAALRPKTHLVMAGWRWLECRGLGERKMTQLIETL